MRVSRRSSDVTFSGSSRGHNGLWGEAIITILALPGAVAAVTLALPFALGPGQVTTVPAPVGEALAWLAVMSPVLSLVGGATLIVGVLLASLVPGRRRVKWIILALGVVLWAATFYALSVPGLIELP
jgi:hypothetical protein